MDWFVRLFLKSALVSLGLGIVMGSWMALSPGAIIYRPAHVHLNLLGRDRTKQLKALRQRIETLVPTDEPLIIAGDFNDWRQQACKVFTEELALREVFESLHGMPARSFAKWDC